MGWHDIVDLSTDELVKLRQYSPYELESKLSEYINHDGTTISLCLKLGAICDCIFNIFMFADEHDLNNNEFSIIFKLVITLLINCDKKLAKQDNLNFFKTSLLLSNEEITEDEEVDKDDKEEGTAAVKKYSLSLETTKKIIDYILQSFFQHHELYWFMFHEEQPVQIISQELNIEVVPVIQPNPAPLEEAICEEWYDVYVDPKPVQQEPDDEEDSPRKRSMDYKNSLINADVDKTTAEFMLLNFEKDEMKRLITHEAVKRLTDVKVEFEKKINEKKSLLMKSVKN